MKSRAAVAIAAGKPLEVVEVDVEGPRAGECLVRIVATGVCHTDAHTLSGGAENALFPAILGHEGGGIVEEVGPGVTSLQPGDHVIPLYVPECGSCRYCVSPQTNLCGELTATQRQGLMPDGTSRFSLNGERVFHYMGTSTFSEYTVVPEVALAKIPKQAPLDKACLLGCGVTTGIGAVFHTANAQAGCTAAVFGLGGVGVSCIQGLRLRGAERIIAIDVNERKFELARQLGATDCINPLDTGGKVAEKLADMTDGGVDFAFECVGNVDVMADALQGCHKGWGVCVVLGLAPAGEVVSTPPFSFVAGRSFRGSAFGGVSGRSELPGLVSSYMEGQIEIDALVSGSLPLEKVNDAFQVMHEGECIRTVIRF